MMRTSPPPWRTGRHVHAYQRTKMVYKGVPVDESTGKGANACRRAITQ